MQYLVVTEDTLEQRWQAELLIESLKLIEVEAIAAVVTNRNCTLPCPFIKFEGCGKNSPKNKPLGCFTALEQGIVKQPFVLLDPDTFLVNEIPISEGITNGGGTYQFNSVPLKLFKDACYSQNTNVYHYAATINELQITNIEYETSLVSPKVAKYVVRYSDGYPPYFTKNFDSIDFSFNVPLPFKKILGTPILSRPNVSLMQTLVRSWTNRNGSRLKDLMF
jgi:hypothetical protein